MLRLFHLYKHGYTTLKELPIAMCHYSPFNMLLQSYQPHTQAHMACVLRTMSAIYSFGLISLTSHDEMHLPSKFGVGLSLFLNWTSFQSV